MTIIPMIVARGYGISFRDIEKTVDGDNALFKFPKELKRGDLVMIWEESNGVIVPGIKIGDEVTVCVAFYGYIRDAGWRMFDISCLPQNYDELKATSGNIKIKTAAPNMDMSGYEIVSAFDYGDDSD